MKYIKFFICLLFTSLNITCFSFWGNIEDNFFHIPNWKEYKSKNFKIHYFDGSYAQKDLQIIELQLEKGLEKICILLDIHPFEFKPYLQKKIPVYLYPDRKTKRTLTHNSRNGHMKDFRIHVIYNNVLKRDILIELAEWIIKSVWGDQEIDFIKEGLKYACSGSFFDVSVHDWAYYYLKNKNLNLKGLHENRNFRKDNGFYAIPVSASFMLFLLENRDISILHKTTGGNLNPKRKVKKLYLTKRRNFKRHIQNIYSRKSHELFNYHKNYINNLEINEKALNRIENILKKVKKLGAFEKNEW